LGRVLDFHAGCSDVKITNSRFRQCRLPVNGADLTNLFVSDCSFLEVTDNCLYFGGTEKGLVSNCYFNTGDEAVVISGIDWVISNNFFENINNKCIANKGASDNLLISGNLFKSTGSPNAITDRPDVGTTELGSIAIKDNIFEQDINYALIYLANRKLTIVENNLFKVTSSTGGRIVGLFNDTYGTLVSVANNTFEKNYSGGNVIDTSLPLNVSDNIGLDYADYGSNTGLLQQKVDINSSAKVIYNTDGSSPDLLLYREDSSIFTGNSLGYLSFGGTDNATSEPTSYAGVKAVATSGHGGTTNGTALEFGTKPDSAFTGVNYVLRLNQDGSLHPIEDNTKTLGLATNRWNVVYAGTGTINTSDDREKTYLDITKVESAVALELKQNMRKFKWNDAIKVKGDNARIHFGTSAQTVKAIFEKHGLVAEDYGMLCYDEWGQEVDEDGNVIVEAGNRYGIRYEELLCFIMSAI
jgi:hypothetical protein